MLNVCVLAALSYLAHFTHQVTEGRAWKAAGPTADPPPPA